MSVSQSTSFPQVLSILRIFPDVTVILMPTLAPALVQFEIVGSWTPESIWPIVASGGGYLGSVCYARLVLHTYMGAVLICITIQMTVQVTAFIMWTAYPCELSFSLLREQLLNVLNRHSTPILCDITTFWPGIYPDPHLPLPHPNSDPSTTPTIGYIWGICFLAHLLLLDSQNQCCNPYHWFM